MRRNENWNDRDFRGSDYDRGEERTWKDRHPRSGLRSDDPDDIEADIRRTRVEMDETLDELIRRLEPGRLLGDIWHSMRGQAGRAGSSAAHAAGRAGNNAAHLAASAAGVAGSRLAREVARHPLPSAVIGAGIAWFIAEQARGGSNPRRDHDDWDDNVPGRYRGGPMDRSEERLRGYSGYNPDDGPDHRRHRSGPLEQARNVGSQAAGTARNAAHSVGNAADHAAHSVADAGRRALHAAEHAAERGMHTVSDVAHRVGDRASTGVHVASRRVSRTANNAAENIADSATHAWERYPLGVALAALGAGLLAGMAAPNTRQENRWMGHTSRRLRREAIDTAREHAAEAIETGSERVAQAAESMAERAEHGLQGREGRHGEDDKQHRSGNQGRSGGAGEQRESQSVGASSGYAKEHRESGQGRHEPGQPSGQSGSQIEPRH